MKNSLTVKKLVRFQYVKSFRSAFVLTLLPLSLLATACSDDGNTASKRNQSGSKTNPKPTPQQNKNFTHDSFAALLNIGLFSIDRAAEIAVKDKEASVLLSKDNCQTVAVTENQDTKNIEITTATGSCAKARSPSTKWSGLETLQVQLKDNFISQLSSSITDELNIDSQSPKRNHTIKQTTLLSPNANSASDNVFTVYSRTQIATVIEEGEKDRAANFDVVIKGSAQISKTTGQMSAIEIDEAIIYLVREDKITRHTTSSEMKLVPENSGLQPLSCGRYVGRMNITQTLWSKSVTDKTLLKGTLVFSNQSVSDPSDVSTKTKVADCLKGLETLELDLREAGNKVLNNMKAVKGSGNGGREAVDDEQETDLIVSE